MSAPPTVSTTKITTPSTTGRLRNQPNEYPNTQLNQFVIYLFLKYNLIKCRSKVSNG